MICPAGPVPDVAQCASLLFSHGMADPLGGEYREITVRTADVWSLEQQNIQTHGWVLSSRDKAAPKLAVCWNGLVYPVIGTGAPCDVRKDINALLAASTSEENKEKHGFWTYGTPLEKEAVSWQTLLLLKIPLLQRLGESVLAGRVLDAWRKSGFPPDDGYLDKPGELYAETAKMWLFTLFDRTICAFMRCDDRVAMQGLHLLKSAGPAIRSETAGVPAEGGLGEDRFDFLNQVPDLIAELKRRAKEQPSTAAVPADARQRIHALIWRLEDLSVFQDGQPGGVDFSGNPIVKSLIKEGNAAVGPLLECLERDQRLTRSVHFWRDFGPWRTVLGVQEPAYTALACIFHRPFIRVQSTGYNLTWQGQEGREAVAREIRRYWKMVKGLSPAEGWFTVLGDDNASVDDWVQAAGNIVRPQNQRVMPGSTMGPEYETVPGPSTMSGVSLLAKHDPSVTDLLRLRMEEVEVRPTQKFGEMPPGSALADDLLKWDPLGGAGAIHARRDDKDAKLDHGKSMHFWQREGEYPASL